MHPMEREKRTRPPIHSNPIAKNLGTNSKFPGLQRSVPIQPYYTNVARLLTPHNCI